MKKVRERQTSYDIAYMWNLLKNDLNELNYKTETDFQTERMNLQFPGERGAGGGIVREFGIGCIYTQLFKIDHQQGPTIWQRECYSMFCT